MQNSLLKNNHQQMIVGQRRNFSQMNLNSQNPNPEGLAQQADPSAGNNKLQQKLNDKNMSVFKNLYNSCNRQLPQSNTHPLQTTQ